MIYVKELYAGYGNSDIIKNISFKVDNGEKLCIIGPNGCGKTTMLRAIAGLLKYRGEVFLNNKDLSTLKRIDISRSMAFMAQLSSVYFTYSVYDTVALGRYAVSSKKIFSEINSKDNEIILSSLKRVELLDIKDKLITELSGGQLQRVFLARVFAQEPNTILLDEPTNHLDIKHQIELVELLEEWTRERGCTLISVMHDINLAMKLADKVIVMNDGEIVCMGKPSEIIQSNILEDVYKIDINSFMKKSYSIWNK